MYINYTIDYSIVYSIINNYYYTYNLINYYYEQCFNKARLRKQKSHGFRF